MVISSLQKAVSNSPWIQLDFQDMHASQPSCLSEELDHEACNETQILSDWLKIQKKILLIIQTRFAKLVTMIPEP